MKKKKLLFVIPALLGIMGSIHATEDDGSRDNQAGSPKLSQSVLSESKEPKLAPSEESEDCCKGSTLLRFLSEAMSETSKRKPYDLECLDEEAKREMVGIVSLGFRVGRFFGIV